MTLRVPGFLQSLLGALIGHTKPDGTPRTYTVTVGLQARTLYVVAGLGVLFAVVMIVRACA